MNLFDYYLSIKALHIIFVVTWFAGLFYIVRLFIYATENNSGKNPEPILQKQYKIMMKKLWFIITWPSAIITLILGITLIISNPSLLAERWIHIKLLILIFLFIYQLLNHRIYKQIYHGVFKLSSFKLRLWNELATVFLFAIVFLAILKNTISVIWSISAIIMLVVLLFLAIKSYNKIKSEK